MSGARLFLALLLSLWVFMPMSYANDKMAEPTVKPLQMVSSVSVSTVDHEGLSLSLGRATLTMRERDPQFSQLAARLLNYLTEGEMADRYYWTTFKKQAVEMQQARLNDGLPTDKKFSRLRDVFVRRADNVAVSFLERDRIHSGGDSPAGDLHSVYGRNIDTATGQYLTMDEVFTGIEELAGAIEAQLRRDYPDAPFIGNKDLNVAELLRAGERELTARGGGIMAAEVHEGVGTWTLESRGATFYFNPPSLGAGRDGIYAATILFDEYPRLFREKYRRAAPGYCIEIVPGIPVRSVAGDGSGVTLGIYENDAGFYIASGSWNYQDVPTAKEPRALLVCPADGGAYLYMDAVKPDQQFPWHELRIFDLKATPRDKKTDIHHTLLASEITAINKTWNIMSDPNRFFLNDDRPEVVGSNPLANPYRVGSDGMPARIGE
ncbi:MAG: hypothetical protein IJ849_11860 [Selenomonadaceae bacterium]|nr:hypothetical protein [Selenomonadaceae bacterium]